MIEALVGTWTNIWFFHNFFDVAAIHPSPPPPRKKTIDIDWCIKYFPIWYLHLGVDNMLCKGAL